jgi:hypothetical protein
MSIGSKPFDCDAGAGPVKFAGAANMLAPLRANRAKLSGSDDRSGRGPACFLAARKSDSVTRNVPAWRGGNLQKHNARGGA